jgi:hypothetical protein
MSQRHAGEVRTSVRLPGAKRAARRQPNFCSAGVPTGGVEETSSLERLDDGEILATNALLAARGYASGPLRARTRC